jgi:hypothetical protein
VADPGYQEALDAARGLVGSGMLPEDAVLGRHPPCCDMIKILESGSSAIAARISDTAVSCRATGTFIS